MRASVRTMNRLNDQMLSLRQHVFEFDQSMLKDHIYSPMMSNPTQRNGRLGKVHGAAPSFRNEGVGPRTVAFASWSASFYIVLIHPVLVWTAISGTPGTGKTTAGQVLLNRGRRVVELSDFIKEHKLEGRLDRKRQTHEIDIGSLDKALSHEIKEENVILVGHLAHLLSVDIIVVLRCKPSRLKERLEARRYPAQKVRENMEAEGCDVILVESVETGKTVLEIDTTPLSPKRCADAIEEILAGEREKYAVGHIDWSEEVLGWF